MPNWNLDRIAERFQQAAFDPHQWPDALHALSCEVGAVGAALLCEDKRISGVPFSPDLEGLYSDYIQNGWIEHDERYAALPILMRKGVACDQDLVTPEDIATRPYYRDFLARHDCRWFAGLGHVFQSGAWVIPIQRTIRQGPFEPEEMRRLSTLCRAFADAGFLSRRLGIERCAGLADAMAIMRHPAIVLDNRGRVLALNRLAECWMGRGFDARQRSLCLADPKSQANLENLIAKALDLSMKEDLDVDATIVVDRDGMPVNLRAIALRDWSRFTFTGASVLLVLDRLPTQSLLLSTYSLTKAELKLALLLASGRSVAQSAGFLGVSYETARSQLRSIFVKTDTHRQGQLVARIRELHSPVGPLQSSPIAPAGSARP